MVVWIGLALLVSITALAWFKGGAAERYGAILNASGYLSITALQFASNGHMPLAPMVWADLLIATGFLWLSVRYNSLWLGVAMMLQGAEFAIHTQYLTSLGEQPIVFGIRLYALGENLISLAVLLTLLGATLTTMRKRQRKVISDDDLWETAET